MESHTDYDKIQQIALFGIIRTKTTYANGVAHMQKKIRIISEIDPIYDTKDWRTKRLRTCGYTRVSTDSDDQMNSMVNQREHYEEYIQRNPNWEYVGIFSDEGISGTGTKKRKGFLEMVEACKDGKIDLIVVKDVSRFARNVKDCLSTVEELLTLDPPVGIFFENHNLNTLEVGTKIFLTMLAMFAELDSELKSRSVDFGLQRIYNKSNYPCPANNLLGYVKDGKYGMKIEPEGAKTVRLIYDLFLSGYSQSEIAETLMELSLTTAMKNLTWTAGSVSAILENEKFCGDFFMRKKYTESFLTHKTKTNKGQRRLYYETDHHDAIVSRAEQARVLLLLASNHASPFFNHEYKIEVIIQGLLRGFIPMNPVFGGYDAGHYLGALVMANLPDMDIETEVAHITGAKRVRKELFGNKDFAAITISKQGLTFSARCINLMKNTEIVEILLHPSERLLAVRKTRSKNAVPWSNSAISARELSCVLYELMGWNKNWKYKITANYFEKNGKQVIFFDLNCCEFLIKNNENKNFPTRAIPGKWLYEFGEELPDYILLCRRALAGHLKNWDLDALPSEVACFEIGFDLPSRAEAEQKISEMRLRHE
jgi:DNA invertase Pin-like site-specific DNA recombinase